jgi:pimeloyl-ACP methyl ester carboxylesterase
MSTEHQRHPPLTASTARSSIFQHAADPRFEYALHVPPPWPGAPPPGLVVAVHHTVRNFIECRDRFAGFGNSHRQVVLAPLFPAGVLGDGNADGYKPLREGDLRYDDVLNAMVDEVAAATGCDGDRFFLFGYSGGGQFAHRYLLLHPGRVRAASVGAPGQVTVLDPDAAWPAGVRDVESLYGHPVDLAALREVPLQLLVGDADTRTDEIAEAPPNHWWRSDDERRAANRIDRLRVLQRSLTEAGVEVEFELMPGVSHGEGTAPAIELAQKFFARFV